MVTTPKDSQPFGTLGSEAPHLAAVIEYLGPLPPSSRGSVSHHPLAYLKHGQESWRRETLRVLDRAVEIVRPILERTGRLRRMSSRLRDGSQFNPAIAEVVAGARMAAITNTQETMVIDPPDGLPDLAFELEGRRVYAEVYAPRSWRQLDLLDDIRARMKDEGSSCRFHLVFPRQVTRRAEVVKTIVERLRGVADDVVRADVSVATFSAETLESQWNIQIGSAAAIPDECDLIGWAHRDDHGPPTSVLGSIEPRYVPVQIEAAKAMSDLGQLVPGATNLLIVDLSGGPIDPFSLAVYEKAAREAAATHPSLSAVLLTGRSCRLRPAPSTEFESCAWYRVLSSSSCSRPFSDAELALLEKPGLIIPGLSPDRQTSEAVSTTQASS